jgi:hypothetical protein
VIFKSVCMGLLNVYKEGNGRYLKLTWTCSLIKYVELKISAQNLHFFFHIRTAVHSTSQHYGSVYCTHMSLMDFVVSPPSCGWSVTDFWGWDAHEAQLRCPDEVDGDIWIWVPGGALNLNYTKLHRPWSPWVSSPSRKNYHGRTGNWTQDLMISSQKLWPLDYEAGHLWLFL